jgi:cell division protein FtsZ
MDSSPEADMSINISVPTNNVTPEMKPRITVFGVGGAGGNAVNNMIQSQLEGVDFVVGNTDSQALAQSSAERRIQLGVTVTQGLGAGSRPDVGRAAADEAMDDILGHLDESNMVFVTAGMGGGTGTGAAPVIARAAREQGILTVGVVTKPFTFEGAHRMRIAEAGIEELEQFVDTLIIIPNQNLFRIANEKTTFADAFKMADDVLYSGVRGVTDLMVMPGLINLDFADIRAVMSEMGKAMMGTGEAEGERRALDAAEAAIANPLLDDISMDGATGVLINITGGGDMTLFEVDEAANRIRSEVDPEAHIIFGSTFDESIEGRIRVSIVATGMNAASAKRPAPTMLDAFAEPVTVPAPPPEPVREAAVQRPANVVEMPGTPAIIKESVGTGNETGMPQPVLTATAPEPKPAAVATRDTPPPATPGTNRSDAFIPPAPQERAPGEIAKAPDPFAAAAMANGAREQQKAEAKPDPREKGPSLFERVTGTTRAAKIAKIAKMEMSPATTETAPQPAKPGQPRLGNVHPGDRLAQSQSEEDLLDIPAFLRRQAN